MQERYKNFKCLLLNGIAFSWSHPLAVFSRNSHFYLRNGPERAEDLARNIIAVDNPLAWRIRCSHRAYSALPPSLQASFTIASSPSPRKAQALKERHS